MHQHWKCTSANNIPDNSSSTVVVIVPVDVDCVAAVELVFECVDGAYYLDLYWH